jgi:hypothetical protein
VSFWERLRKYIDQESQADSAAWAELPASEFRRVVEHELAAGLSAIGLRSVGNLRWVRERVPGIRDLVTMGAVKGDSYSCRWGVSLDFVPHVSSSGRVGWHRTPKSARFDLVYDPLDYEGDTTRFALSRFETPRELPVSARRLARRLIPELEGFLGPIETLSALLAAFAEKDRRPFVRFGADSYSQERLACAFVLAKSGAKATARMALERFAQTYAPPAATVGELKALLEVCV